MTRAILTVLLALGISAPVFAFKLKVTQEGNLVRWTEDNITVYLDSSLKTLGPKSQVETTIKNAFEAWVNKASLSLDFNFVSKDCGGDDYSSSGNNQNCIFAAKRSKTDAEDIGGNTFLTYSKDDGEILDADVVFFIDVKEWTLNDEAGKLNVYAVALHEAGHLLGMDHSDVDKAAMYPMTNVDNASVKRLHDDDIHGAKALYDKHKSADIDCAAVPVNFVNFSGLLALLF